MTIDYTYENGCIGLTWEGIESEFGAVWDENGNYDDRTDSKIIQRLLHSGAPKWVAHRTGVADDSGWWIKEPEGATTIDYSTNRLGDVQFNGITVHLTQEAYYAAEDNAEPFYRAEGVDDDGDTYTVTWQVKDEFWHYDENGKIVTDWSDGSGDESRACDWHDYTVTPDDPSLWR
jgi:hypothetical protein